MDPSFFELIQSSRVSDRTRMVLLGRAQPTTAGYSPQTVVEPGYLILKRLLELLIPQDNSDEFVEIAAVIDHRRSSTIGDGWRYDNMPPDHLALTSGLEALEKTAHILYQLPFLQLHPAQQTTLLKDIQNGDVVWPQLDSARWFEDLLADAVEIYASHPSTLACMGFSGIAFLPQWSEIGLDTAQPWEPVNAPERERRS